MINTCAMLGMVLAFMRLELGALTPFLIAAVVGAILCFPRLEAFVAESMLTWKQSSRRED